MTQHVLIIGGGINGVCIAYYLSQDRRFRQGAISVTIVEANEIASGASGKAGGFLAMDWHGPTTASLAKLSYMLHQQLAEELGGEKLYGYRKLTSLSYRARVSGKPYSPTENPALSHSDLEFRRKPPSQGVIHTSWLEGSYTENVEVVAGEDTTAQVHPELFTKTLYEAAKARGVQCIKGRPCVWNKRPDGQTVTIDTSAGRQELSAETIVLAAGPWTGRVAKELFDTNIPLFDLPGHSILIRPAQPLPAHAVFASIYGAEDLTGTPEIFVRPDGLVYVAGENTGAPLPQGTADVTLDTDAIRKLVKASGVISSALKYGVVEAEQLCYRPVTGHGGPFIGPLLGDQSVFVAAGHGPWGITLAPGTGKVIAEIILDGVAKSANISQLMPSYHIM